MNNDHTPLKTITSLKVWMMSATPQEQDLLAAKAGTTKGHLYQLSGGYRQASAELAGRLESASAEMSKSSRGRLPRIYRTDLCAACVACPYAHKCLGERALISEFPIVSEKQLELDL